MLVKVKAEPLCDTCHMEHGFMDRNNVYTWPLDVTLSQVLKPLIQRVVCVKNLL